MKPITQIMACIDLSDYSKMTLEYALELARDPNTRLIVFNVINQRDIANMEMIGLYYSSSINVENYARDLRKERDEKLRKFLKENFFDQKSRMEIQIEQGFPAECIIEAASKQDVDLVVIGNKGRGNLSRVLFGSTAEKVFRHSLVPVVSVRDKENFKRRYENDR